MALIRRQVRLVARRGARTRPHYGARGPQEGWAVGRRGGFVILPARMQDVHTCNRRGEPFTSARTRWMLGSQRRLVRRWEWLRFIPNDGCLPQTSHTAATTRTLLER